VRRDRAIDPVRRDRYSRAAQCSPQRDFRRTGFAGNVNHHGTDLASAQDSEKIIPHAPINGDPVAIVAFDEAKLLQHLNDLAAPEIVGPFEDFRIELEKPRAHRCARPPLVQLFARRIALQGSAFDDLGVVTKQHDVQILFGLRLRREGTAAIAHRDDVFAGHGVVGNAAPIPLNGLVLRDFMGGIEVFCIALAASLPAVLPLLLIEHP
jgi:hypothetical protein